ncbi:MAG: cysteine desulfurase NifS [Clostridia bacterium]|nr:cysteine desulfurase NifS [Clostridia bacterium]MEE0790920.1 cysteine desulfurase NifS [Clostridia bacterium]
MKIKYFDNAATTQVNQDVIKEMLPYFSIEYGNPSSLYSIGRRAKRALEEARRKIANIINCKPNEIYFTSCGTESDNLAIKGIAYANKEKGKHIITSKIEHPAVLNTCKELEEQGYKVTYLDVDQNGIVNVEQLKASIKTDTILITIMFANNEIGTIQPIEEIGKIAKENNIIFHTDAVQAMGNLKIDVKKLNINALSMSAHKFYAPKGIGALYVGEDVNFKQIQNGGHQEKNKRAGTENLAEIVGMSKALELIYKNFENHNNKIKELRDYYIEKIQSNIVDSKLNGDRINRLPGNANMSFKNINAEELLFELDDKGICASAGSACSSGSTSPSHVLTAIGLPPEWANGTLRVTIGMNNTKEEVDYLINALVEIVNKKINKI